MPDFRLQESLRIANVEQKVTRACDGHVETAKISQETQTALHSLELVAPDTIEYDYVLLSALERIHSVHLYVLKLLALASEPGRDCIFQVVYLSFVWGYDSDFALKGS